MPREIAYLYYNAVGTYLWQEVVPLEGSAYGILSLIPPLVAISLAIKTKRLDFQLEQVQDFTPTPMTVSTETWYSGYDPYTLEPVFSAKTPKDKLAQRHFFFWYKPEERIPLSLSFLLRHQRISLPNVISSSGISQRNDVVLSSHYDVSEERI